MLLQRIVYYALLIGAVAGIIVTAAQLWQTVPVIQAAEAIFEGETNTDIGRTGWVLLSNVSTAVGFALLMLAVMAAAYRNQVDLKLDWRHGLAWALAGWTVFFLSPSIGIPPKIPGEVGALLFERQVWWTFAILCSAAGLAALAFGRGLWRWPVVFSMVVLYVVGLMFGAPTTEIRFSGLSPAEVSEMMELSRAFFYATGFTNGILWLCLGFGGVWSLGKMMTVLRSEISVDLQKEEKI